MPAISLNEREIRFFISACQKRISDLDYNLHRKRQPAGYDFQRDLEDLNYYVMLNEKLEKSLKI